MQDCFSKNFINFFIGQLLTHLGDSFLQICTVAIMMQQVEKPGSIIAMILFFFLLPSLLISPIAGIMTDKFSRKKIMLTSTFYRFLITLIFIWYVAGHSNNISEICAYFYSFLCGVGMATFYPAKMATVPNIVNSANLKPANSLISGSGNLSITAGAIFAGLFIKFFGLANCFNFGLSMYLFAFLFLLCIKVGKDKRLVEEVNKINLLHFLKTHKKTLYSIVCVVVITFMGATFYNAMNAIATDNFRVSITGLTLLKGIIGLGGCLGIVFNFLFGKKFNSNKLMAVSFGVIAIALFTSSLCTSYLRAFLWLGVMGFFAIILQITIDIMLQKTTHDKVRGKIFGLKSVVTTSVTLLSTLFVSFGIKVIPAIMIVYFVGVMCVVVTFAICIGNLKKN